MLKKKVVIYLISLAAIFQAFGQETYHDLVWDEQEELSFDQFRQEVDDTYTVLYGKFKKLVQKHKSVIETLVKLNPELAIAYTISLKELIADIVAVDQ